jgi:hypothetical protein
MKKLPRITAAEPVIHGVLKIVWSDGYEGVVDLRPTIERGKIFEYLQKPGNFRRFKVSEFGHSIGWINAEGEEIDFGADNLRRKAENQAKLHKLVAELHS